MSRPAPAVVGALHLTAVRGPNAAGAWYWRIRDEQRRTRWTGWARRPEALTHLHQLAGEPEPGPTLRTVGELLRVYLDARERDRELAASSLGYYHRALRHPERLLGELPLEQLDLASLEGYRNARLGEGAAPRTVAHELGSIRSAWRWAVQNEHLQATPLPQVRVKVRGYVLNHRTPTEGEVGLALAQLRGEVLLAAQLLAITGARISEVTGLRPQDVDLRRGVLHLDGKTGPREFPLTPGLRALLTERAQALGERLLALRAGDPQKQVRMALASACAAAGVAAFTPHGLRRMAVNRLLRAGVDPKVAAALTGHSVSVMLTIYRSTSFEEKVEGVRQAGLGRKLTRTRGGGQEGGGAQAGNRDGKVGVLG